MGPTASGKTALALELCAHLPFDIVSVDAAQIYRGMDIGTAKPDRATLAAFPHRLIDIRDIQETYSAAEFQRDACKEMDKILRTGRIPLLLGGTMFYFHTLEHGLSPLPSADPDIRREISALAARSGWPALHGKLQAIDPQTASRIDVNDGQRIQRALEIHAVSGCPPATIHQTVDANALPYHVIKIAVAPAQRSMLHDRIAERFRAMLADGLVDEVQALASPDVAIDAPAG